MARWWAEFKEPEPAELATGAGPADMANRPGFRSRALRPAYGVGEISDMRRAAQPAGQVLQSRLGAGDEGDARTRGGEADCELFADAAGSPGDEDALAVEVHRFLLCRRRSENGVDEVGAGFGQRALERGGEVVGAADSHRWLLAVRDRILPERARDRANSLRIEDV